MKKMLVVVAMVVVTVLGAFPLGGPSPDCSPVKITEENVAFFFRGESAERQKWLIGQIIVMPPIVPTFFDECVIPLVEAFPGLAARIALTIPHSQVQELAALCPEQAIEIARAVSCEAGDIVEALPELAPKIAAAIFSTSPDEAVAIAKCHPEQRINIILAIPAGQRVGFMDEVFTGFFKGDSYDEALDRYIVSSRSIIEGQNALIDRVMARSEKNFHVLILISVGLIICAILGLVANNTRKQKVEVTP